MNYRITNGSISFGADTVLEEVNFEVKDKEKVAIVRKKWKRKDNFAKSSFG